MSSGLTNLQIGLALSFGTQSRIAVGPDSALAAAAAVFSESAGPLAAAFAPAAVSAAEAPVSGGAAS